MMRKTSYVIGGTMMSLFAVTFSPTIDGTLFAARSESFDARWVALSSTTKQDRLAPPRPSGEIQVVATTDTERSTTVLNKIEVAAQQPKRSPVREIPRDSARKEKLPVGCDPSFSPVAVPAMAHVTGRCLAQRDTGQMLAALAR
jgi:hypothetical protein